MPFYEYECTNCKFYVEALQKISDAPLVKCPSCGKQSLHRLVSAPNFRLKGSGWYETDFKSDKEAKRNIAATEDKPAESKDGEESKSARTPRRGSASKAVKKAKPVAAKKAKKKPGKKAAAKKSTKGKVKTAIAKKAPAKKKLARKK